LTSPSSPHFPLGTLFYGQTQRREEASRIAERLLLIKERSGGRLVSNMPHLASLVTDSKPSVATNTTVEDNIAGQEEISERKQSSAREAGESEETYLIRNCRSSILPSPLFEFSSHISLR
jgi:hypothetical protein